MGAKEEILSIIRNNKDISEYVDNEDVDESISLTDYLKQIMQSKKLKKSEIVFKSNLSSVYVYKILSGERTPQRDKLLALCFGLSMTLSQTMKALSLSGIGGLHTRNKRDCIIIHSLSKGISLMECNELLYDFGEKTLN